MTRTPPTPWRFGPPEHHATIGSTSTELLGDPVPGRVVVADHQSAGLGRRGRVWSAPPGTALAVSACVPAPAGELLGWVPLVAGLAVVGALARSRYPVDAALKWPNDVLGPDGRKLAGVLCQARGHPDHGAVVVIGTGLNVDQTTDQVAVPGAVSWRLLRGGAVLPDSAREAFVADYLSDLADLLRLLSERPDLVRAQYRARCATLGRPVRVHRPGGATREGVATQVADDGSLVVEDAAGEVTTHHAADVVHLRPVAPA